MWSLAQARKFSVALKAGAWYTICNVLLKTIAFITVPIFTRLMTKSDIGQFASLASWISILSVVITLGLSNSIPLAKYDYKDDFKNFLSSITFLNLIIVAAIYIVILPIQSTIAGFMSIPLYSLHIVMIHLLLSPGKDILLREFIVKLEYKPVVAITLLCTTLSIGLSIILVKYGDDGFQCRTIGTYLPLIVIDGAITILLVHRGRKVCLEHWKYALAICLPLVVHHLAGNIMHASDRIMIQKLCGSEPVALYSVAYSGAFTLNVIRNSLESAWDPWVYDKISASQEKSIKAYSYLYITFFSLLCFVIVALAPEVLFIMGGRAYMEAMYVVPPVVLGYMCTLVYSLYGGIERYYKQQNYFALYGSICAVLNIVLNYFFIPLFGYIAAAFTTLLSCFLEMLLHYFHCKKIGYSKLYDTKFNFIILFITFFICFLMMPLYTYSLTRYIVILVVSVAFVATAYKNRILSYKNRILLRYGKKG